MRKHIVLVADDAPENIDILVGILEDEFLVKVARNGEQVLELVAENDPPDIILLDIVMPGMTGYDVCLKLKSRKKTREIPVIFITALTEMDSIVRGFEVGGVDYIVKPFNTAELMTRLKTHLRLKDVTEILKNSNIMLSRLDERRTATLRKKNALLKETLAEKDALLRNLRDVEAKLRGSLGVLNGLYAKLERVQEEERKTIATEIHDRMGQVLTAIKLNLFRMRPKEGTPSSSRVEETIVLVDEAIRATQNISGRLRPDILDNLGFAEAVRWYGRKMHEASGITFTCVMEPVTGSLGEWVELTLFRVLQEAVTNVIRHARASECLVRIDRTEKGVRMIIEDNGIGIESGQVDAMDSLGIYGMKKRITDAGGEFAVNGRRGKGTTLTAIVPLERRGR